MSMDMQIVENVQKFQWNFNDVKASLQEYTNNYVGLVVNDENLSKMEKVQKEIASTRTKFSKFRLAVKKELEKPFLSFDLQAKELLAMIEDVERPIKDQLDKYEVDRRCKKAVEVKLLIERISNELGLDEKYSSQIVIADKYLNRTQKPSDTKEDIQMKVCWFLDIQKQEKEAEEFRNQKIEMAKFMCESLSAGLVTPLRFEEIENRIDSFDIGGLRKHIETEVQARREREERAAQMAIEKAEREKKEQEERAERTRLIEEEKARKLVEELQVVSTEPQQIEQPKLYKAQFVIYDATAEEINEIKDHISSLLIRYKHAIKPMGK